MLNKDRTLAPEATLELMIHLDRLRRMEERCRDGLKRFVGGRLTREDYLGLVKQQDAAQHDWRRKHEEYVGAARD